MMSDRRHAFAKGAELECQRVPQQNLTEVLLQTKSELQLVFVDAQGNESAITFGLLRSSASRILRGLRDLGLKPKDKVVFQLDSNRDILSSLWACILGGFELIILPVPVSYGNPNRQIDQLRHASLLFDSPHVICSARIMSLVKASKHTQFLTERQLVVLENLLESPEEHRFHQAALSDVALYAFSSGSTGLPKAIALTHQNLITRALGEIQHCRLTQDQVTLNWLPLDHVVNISVYHLARVMTGSKLIYVAKEYILAQPLRWLDLIDRHRVTHTWSPNFGFGLISKCLTEAHGQQWDLSCVQSVMSGGELITRAVKETFIERLSIFGFSAEAVQPAYGLAESSSAITFQSQASHPGVKFHSIDRNHLSGAIVRVDKSHPEAVSFAGLGSILPGNAMRIVDEFGGLVNEDVIGSLHLRGEAITAGYYKNPEANKVFVDGWFDTGDAAFLSDGELVVIGRADTGIVINGANFQNNEIEFCIDQIDGIAPSYTAACLVRHPQTQEPQLAIFFCTSISDPDALILLLSSIRQQLSQKLGLKADYLILIEPDALPKTALGKIQYKKLSENFDNGLYVEAVLNIEKLGLRRSELTNATLTSVVEANVLHEMTWQLAPSSTLGVSAVSSTSNDSPLLVWVDAASLEDPSVKALMAAEQVCAKIVVGDAFRQLDTTCWEIDRNDESQFRRVITSIAKNFPNFTSVYARSTCEFFKVDAVNDAPNILLDATYIVRSVTELAGARAIWLIGYCTKHEIEADPIFLALKAFFKGVGLEYPRLKVGAIDAVDTAAETIIKQLANEDKETEIRFIKNIKYVARLKPYVTTHRPVTQFRSDGAYLITGGLGALGLQLALMLAQYGAGKIVLIGRDISTSHCQDILNAIAGHGANVEIHGVDVGDALVLGSLFERLKSDNFVLSGIFHTAGLAISGSVKSLDSRQLVNIWHAKAHGAWLLHSLTSHLCLDYFVLYSSVSSVLELAASPAYSAANGFLDGLAAYRAQQGQTALSINWSLWDGIERRRSGAQAIQGLGSDYRLGKLDVNKALSSLRSLLAEKKPNMLVIDADWSSLKNAGRNGRASPLFDLYDDQLTLSPDTHASNLSELLMRSDREDRLLLVQNVLTSEVTALLKPQLADSQWHGGKIDFFEMGMNSISAVALKSRIEELLEVNLPPSVLYDYADIRTLTEYIVDQVITFQV